MLRRTFTLKKDDPDPRDLIIYYQRMRSNVEPSINNKQIGLTESKIIKNSQAVNNKEVAQVV